MDWARAIRESHVTIRVVSTCSGLRNCVMGSVMPPPHQKICLSPNPLEPVKVTLFGERVFAGSQGGIIPDLGGP